MNKVFALIPLALLIAACSQAPMVSTAPTPIPHIGTSRAPILLPGCTIPDSSLIGANAPFEVIMKLHLNQEGKVESVQMTQGSRSEGLNQAFIAAAKACGFSPALREDKPVAAERELSFAWLANTLPRGINQCFTPDYPVRARRAEVEGVTLLEFYFENETSAPIVRVYRSAGSAILDNEAVKSAASCLANPNIRKDLKPKQVYRQEIAWKLM